MKRIAVVTSGGDAPGMNAAVRAGRSGVVIGLVEGQLAEIPLEDALAPSNKVTAEMLALADALAR